VTGSEKGGEKIEELLGLSSREFTFFSHNSYNAKKTSLMGSTQTEERKSRSGEWYDK